MPTARTFALALAATGLAAPPLAAQDRPADSSVREIQAHVNEPERLEPTDERIGRLKLPDGFRIAKFAEGLENPRMIAVADDGTVYVTRRDLGDVVMLRDTDNDGRADERRVVAARPQMHGIAIDGRKMYLATVNDVYATEINADGTLQELRRIIDDLPDGGQHPNRTLAVGPDGMLYVTVGSTCNACDETDPESATLLRATPDGKQRRIFASGLRNTIGLDWHPATAELWAMDMGIDWLGDDDQPEELNRLEEGKRYGWPYIYADGRENPQDEPPGGITMDQWREMSEEPALTYTAHASPLQLVFYKADAFPAEYRGDAFVTFRGSWNRAEPSGYEVARVRFEDSRPVAFEPFVTGFVEELEGGGGHGYLARLAGLAVAKDGSLLVGDDSNGVIYRVSYEGEVAQERADGDAEMAIAAATPPVSGPAGAEPAGLLALAALEPASPEQLQVVSGDFEAGQAIPRRFSAYDENFSPAVDWSEGPEGTRSYVLLVEDPDADQPKPFVHWLAYGIPADVTRLGQAVPPQPRLLQPEGVLQGRNSYGSSGYQGMKPPEGDPAHRYHFQVFALDRELDLEPGVSREEVLEAMRGHVLAAGELVGTFAHRE
jgi:Raf kinase inhibitor-like YbhB/YbcL family protein